MFSNDYIVDKIEKKCGVRGIESTQKGLFYFVDGDKKGIVIMICRDGEASYIGLNKKQAEALIGEFQDICETYGVIKS